MLKILPYIAFGLYIWFGWDIVKPLNASFTDKLFLFISVVIAAYFTWIR